MGHANSSSPTTSSLPRYILSQNPKNKTGTWSSKATAARVVHDDGSSGEKGGQYGTSNNDGGWGERQGRCGEAADEEGEGRVYRSGCWSGGRGVVWGCLVGGKRERGRADGGLVWMRGGGEGSLGMFIRCELGQHLG